MTAKITLSSFVLFIHSLVIVSQIFGGAWPQQKGGYYFKFAGNYLFTRNEFNHNGASVPIFDEREGFENASFKDLNLTVYLEYGLLDNFTLITELPYKFLKSEWDKFIEFTNPDGSPGKIVIPESPATHGLADLKLLGRFAFLQNPMVLSLQGGVHIPLGYESKPANDGPPLGTGELQVEGLLLFGKSFWPAAFYTTGGFGYRYRKGPLKNEILFNFEIGYTFNKFLVKLYIEGIRNTGTPPDLAGMPIVTPLPGGGGVVPNVIVGDKHETKLSPAIIYNVSNSFAVQAELFNTVAGVNTTDGTTFSIGLVLKR